MLRCATLLSTLLAMLARTEKHYSTLFNKFFLVRVVRPLNVTVHHRKMTREIFGCIKSVIERTEK